MVIYEFSLPCRAKTQNTNLEQWRKTYSECYSILRQISLIQIGVQIFDFVAVHIWWIYITNIWASECMYPFRSAFLHLNILPHLLSVCICVCVSVYLGCAYSLDTGWWSTPGCAATFLTHSQSPVWLGGAPQRPDWSAGGAVTDCPLPAPHSHSWPKQNI